MSPGDRCDRFVAALEECAAESRRPAARNCAAIQDDCAFVTVSETAIADATRRLAASGFYAENSSAPALAGVEEARARGLADEDTTAVAIITATGDL
jgi:threonine synthase